MKSTFSYLWIFLLSIVYTVTADASVEVRAKFLTTSDGLSNNSIRYIFQDSKGFVWMSTLNGLNRYDGNSFVSFRPRNDLSFSLADPRGRTLMEDENGFLWIANGGDLFSCYDLKKDCFVDFTGCGEHLSHYRYIAMFSGAVWLWGEQGCRRIVYRDGRFSSEAFSVAKRNLQSDRVEQVYQDENGIVWISTTKGVYYWRDGELHCADSELSCQWIRSLHGKTFFLSFTGDIYQVDAGKHFLKVGHIPGIAFGNDLPGEIALNGEWVIFTSQGGYIFNPSDNSLKRAPAGLDIPRGEVTKDNRNNYWIHNQTGKLHYINAETGDIKVLQLMPPEKVGFIDMERYTIVHDSRDIIWITTYGNGLFAYDLHTEQLQHFTADSNRSDLIASNFLLFIMEDRSGSLWVGSEHTGVSHLRILNEGAQHLYSGRVRRESTYSNIIRMISSMSDGDIWLGTRDGEVFAYDASLSELKKTLNYSSNVYSVCEDTSGVVWMGTRGGGLYIGNRNYLHSDGDSASLAQNDIFCILRDSKGRMWVGTFGGGLDLAEPDGKGGYKFRHFFTETYGMRRIRTLCEDHNGYIWVGTSDGVLIFHPDEMLRNPDAYYRYNWENKSLQSDEIRSIMQDSKRNIWIAETGAGFCVCSPGQDYARLSFTHYGVEDGLVNGMVQSFIEDGSGWIWIPTEFGVSCFNPENKSFENYFFSGDMLSNVYSENCVARLHDGRLIFGSSQGLTIIDPQKVEGVHHAPAVTFTDLKLNGISVRPTDSDSPLNSSLAYVEAVHLRYYQNSFAIDFSTLDYSSALPPKYSYMLEAYDKEWSAPSTLNFAAYKNLESGTYYLHVKACNAAGLWGDKEAVLKIVITPPFWKTTWAFLIYALLILSALYMAYRIIRNMNELRNKVKVEEQLTEYKLVFFTNISHEFRTPLTLIQAALEKMHRMGKIPKEMAYSVKVMDKSTQRMLRLINQLLEFRKMQNNKLALSLEETDVIAFLYEIYLSFKDAAESKKMDFRFVPSHASYKMFIDKGNLDKVTYNLLSNAFKYTPSGGKVDLCIRVDEAERKLIIRVVDTGVGIPKEKRDQLFKRFMQSNFSGNSVGVGLHLTHELVNVHKGTITYEENPEGGSVFTVTLSTDLSVYEEKDFLIPNNVLLREEEMAERHLADMEHAEIVREEQTEDTAEVPEDVLPAAPLNKRKLLIIEDDTDVREFLKEELSVYFEVEAEADGKSGLERAYSYDADLIICDVLMPGLSGFEVTKKLKGDFTTSHIPIILLTALNAPESHLEGVESGADAYITKPFSTKLLLARVFKLIEQRDKLREKFSSDLSIVRPVICTTEKDKEFTEKLTRIVEEQLENPDFTADDFASMMALGRTIFYRKVKGVTGYAPKEYLRVMRMKKAAELLLTTGCTVAEVSYQVGISDPFYFSKCFKAQFGVSPSVYQKNKGEINAS